MTSRVRNLEKRKDGCETIENKKGEKDIRNSLDQSFRPYINVDFTRVLQMTIVGLGRENGSNNVIGLLTTG